MLVGDRVMVLSDEVVIKEGPGFSTIMAGDTGRVVKMEVYIKEVCKIQLDRDDKICWINRKKVITI